jgi:hypothetical protein
VSVLSRIVASGQEGSVPVAGGLEDIFRYEPVPLTEFVRGAQFLNNPALSDEQYEAVRHIERVFYTDLYPLMAAHMDPYWGLPVRMCNTITLQWGKGSGKDHIARVSSLRVAYLLMCLRNPQWYYQMPEQDSIHLLNVASSTLQATRAFFQPMTVAVGRGWFKHHSEALQNTIRYDHNIAAISGSSDTETQEGLNLILGVADEIDAFRSKLTARAGTSMVKTVEGILEMMHTSASTRFPGRTKDEPPVFKIVRISYPRYQGSPIQQLTKKAHADVARRGLLSRHYVSGPKATWEVNPRVMGPEAFAQDYEDDPIMARAKYECRPAGAINPYFQNSGAVEACFTEAPQPLDVAHYRLDGRNWVPVYAFASSLVPIEGALYSMHADLAVKGDRAGIAMSHVVSYEDYVATASGDKGQDEEFVERRPHVKVDFVFSYEASVGENPPREIQIRWARLLCFELVRRGFNVRQMTFDGFQSLDSMQILESKGVLSERVTTDRDDSVWKNLRDLMSEGRVEIHHRPRVLGELLALDRGPNGKVDHPPMGSKDEADALACSVLGALALGGQERGGQSFYAQTVFGAGTDSVMEAPYGMGPGATTWFGPTSGWV